MAANLISASLIQRNTFSLFPQFNVESWSLAPFVSSQSIFPDDDITNCTIPHIRVYSGRSTTIVHIVELQSLKLYVAMCFEEDPTAIFVAIQPNRIEKD